MTEMSVRESRSQGMLGELVVMGSVTAVAVALLPALVVGFALAELLRWRRLRWTWALPPLGVSLVVLAAVCDDAVGGVQRAVDSSLAGRVELLDIASAALPWWLAGSCATTVLWKLRRDREDGYHGGERARRLERERGPLGAASAALARRRAPKAGVYAVGQGVKVGRDFDTGRPVFVPPPRSMVTLIGAAGTGKTTLAMTLNEGLVEYGSSLAALDAKGSRAVAHRLLELAERHERQFSLVSLEPFGDERLDRHRLAWNVVGCGNRTEVKDTVMSAEDFSEPYYRTTGERGLLAAAGCLAAEGRVLNAATLAELLQDPDALATRLERQPGGIASEAGWLAGLNKEERSALRGIASKLARLIHSEGGDRLVPAKGEPTLDLELALRTGAIVLFSLPAAAYPEHAPQLSRYLTQQVNAVCGRIIREGKSARAAFWIDDASGLSAGQLPSLYERAREAGVVVMTAVQSLSNLATLGGERLHAAALDDAELVAVLRQSLTDAAHELSALAGVREVYEHSHEVGDTDGWFSHSDETGRRTRRLVEQPVVPPEAIKRLRTGEAFLISKRDGLTTQRIQIEPAES